MYAFRFHFRDPVTVRCAKCILGGHNTQTHAMPLGKLQFIIIDISIRFDVKFFVRTFTRQIIFFSFFCFLSATRPDHQHQPSNTNALIYSNRRTISAQFKYTHGMLLVVNSKRFQYQYRQRKETQNQYR